MQSNASTKQGNTRCLAVRICIYLIYKEMS
jgi:hypothetical protein